MKLQKGFTLMELMIVVIIVGILASVAAPAYQDYVTRGRISEATAALASDRVQMEQYYQDNRRYATAAGGSTCGGTRPTPKNFTITCIAADPLPQGFLLTATGINSMVGFTYTVDQNNAKYTTAAPTGWSAAVMPKDCWITQKGGSC